MIILPNFITQGLFGKKEGKKEASI